MLRSVVSPVPSSSSLASQPAVSEQLEVFQDVTLVTELMARRLYDEIFLNGDPYGIRTRVTAVKGRCLNRLTNGPIQLVHGGEGGI